MVLLVAAVLSAPGRRRHPLELTKLRTPVVGLREFARLVWCRVIAITRVLEVLRVPPTSLPEGNPFAFITRWEANRCLVTRKGALATVGRRAFLSIPLGKGERTRGGSTMVEGIQLGKKGYVPPVVEESVLQGLGPFKDPSTKNSCP